MEKRHLFIPVLPWLPLLLLALPSPAIAQTVVNVDPMTTLRGYTQKPGANMGTPTNYDSGIMYKNLLLPANVGGEGALLQQIWQVQSGATPLSTTRFNSNINNSQYDQVPENWWKGANSGLSSHAAQTLRIAPAVARNLAAPRLSSRIRRQALPPTEPPTLSPRHALRQLHPAT